MLIDIPSFYLIAKGEKEDYAPLGKKLPTYASGFPSFVVSITKQRLLFRICKFILIYHRLFTQYISREETQYICIKLICIFGLSASVQLHPTHHIQLIIIQLQTHAIMDFIIFQRDMIFIHSVPLLYP